MLNNPFPIMEDAQGRRWRWKLPLGRALFAVSLFLAGLILCAVGLAQMAIAPGAAGLLCLAPGAWACFYYYRSLQGRLPPNPETFLEVEELGAESDLMPVAQGLAD